MDKNDFIMSLLDWNQSKENQKKGVQAAREIENLDVFIQPCGERYNKNVWENCAVILAERDDKELSPYLPKLLEWLADLNWPGAYRIFNRLARYKETDIFGYLHACIEKAVQEKETQWWVTLLELQYRLSPTKQFAADYLVALYKTEFRDFELSNDAEDEFPLIHPQEHLGQIYPVFLQGIEDMLKKVLLGRCDEAYGYAIIAEKWLRVYLDAHDETISVRDFLENKGYSSAEIDSFYELYRKECLFSYDIEPKMPTYTNDKLRVYQVDNAFVVAILDIQENGLIAPRGAEFTQDRQMKWAKGLEIPRVIQPDKFLGKTMETLLKTLGPVSVFLTFGNNENVPCYITCQGCLVGFILCGDEIIDTETVDLLAPETSS